MGKFFERRSAKRREYFLKYFRNNPGIKNILLVRNGLLGDVISITSVLNRLSSNFPGVNIDVIVGPAAGSILQNFPGVRNVYPFRFSFSALSIFKQVFFFSSFRKNKYDLLLVQEVNTHYTLISLFAGARFRAGFTNKLSALYDYSAERPKIPMAIAEMETVREWTVKKSSDKSYIYLTDEEISQAAEILNSYNITYDDFTVILHPGSSNPDSDRQWVTDRYAELAEELIKQYGAKIIYTGIERDSELIDKIQSRMKSPSISLAGKTGLRNFLAVIKLSDLVIGPDTGIIHLAAALDTPVVMMMGLSDPEDTGPYHPEGKARIARVETLECSPCVHKDPKPEQWEICKNLRPVKCMTMLTTELVMQQVRILLSNKVSKQQG